MSSLLRDWLDFLETAAGFPGPDQGSA